MERTFSLAALSFQFLVGLSRAMILFVVCAGLSFAWVAEGLDIAHGTLYMTGAFAVFRSTKVFGLDLHIFIWPDDFYRKSSIPEAYLGCR